MAENDKSDQITSGGSKQNQQIDNPKAQDVLLPDTISLIQFLFYQIEALINNVASDSKTHDSREEGYWAKNHVWQISGILGTFILSAITIIVLICTLLAVDRYTNEAHTANTLTKQILDANTRAYIQITPNGDPSRTRIQAGKTLAIGAYLYNWGKQPARTSAQGITRYSRTRLANGAGEGLRKLPDYYIWPGTYVNGVQSGGDYIRPESLESLTDGDITDIKAKRGWIYIEVEVRYGNGYITRICDEYPLQTNDPLFMDFELCSDPQSNCTDNDCKQ